MVGNLVQGNRLAAAQGRDLGFTDDNKVFILNRYKVWEVLQSLIVLASIDYRSSTMARQFIARSRALHASQFKRCHRKDFNVFRIA